MSGRRAKLIRKVESQLDASPAGYRRLNMNPIGESFDSSKTDMVVAFDGLTDATKLVIDAASIARSMRRPSKGWRRHVRRQKAQERRMR